MNDLLERYADLVAVINSLSTLFVLSLIVRWLWGKLVEFARAVVMAIKIYRN